MSKQNRGGWRKNNNNNNNNNNQQRQSQQQQQRSEFLNLNDEDEMPSLPAVLHQQQQQRSFLIDDNQMPSLPVNLTTTQRVVSSPFASAVQEPVKTGPQRSVWGKPPPTPAINEPKQQPTPQPLQPPQGFKSATPTTTSLTQKSSISNIETVTEQMASASMAPSPFESPVKESESSSEASSKLDLTEISPPKGASVRVHNGEFPAKRERGNLGRQIKLRANHFHLVLKKAYVVYQYDVELTKKQMPGGAAAAAAAKTEEKIVKNKTIMRAMFLILSKKLLGPKYENKIVYNFSKNLYSLEKLPFEKNITYEINIENTTFMLKLQTINQIKIDPAKPDDPVQIQVLDLIFTQSFNYSCHNLNRSFFTKNCENVSLGFGLELWKGAYASVRPCEIGLTWNLDVAHSAFLTSVDVLEVACNHYRCDINNLKQCILNDKDGTTIGASFLNSYRGRDIKTSTGGFRKKIHGFGPDSSFQFDWSRQNIKTRVTIREYLKEHYKIDLKYPQLPCVNLGKESYLPMELCKTELAQKKNLDEKQTAVIIKETATPAPDRMNYIDRWAQKSGIGQDPILKEYNINVSLKMTELDGRILDAPEIQYTSANIIKTQQIASRGAWDHRNFKFTNPVKVNRWVILNFSRARDDNCAAFGEKLISVGRIHGLQIQPYLCLKTIGDRQRDEQIRRTFEEIYTKYKPLDLVVVVFGGTTTAYKVVKTCGDITYGVATQGVEDRNVNRINDQTVSNILLKVNTKLGGRNFLLSTNGFLFSKHLQDLYRGPLMIFGADVTHPTPDKKIEESIAAVVGSLDKDCCFYAARLHAQKSSRGQAYEMIHDLDKMVTNLLLEHFNINKTFPKKIVFFRDGVSEGQFSLVLRFEINKIRSACQTVSPGYKPAITFVIVQKRHHTRLFPANTNDSHGKAMNVPPGTIVDSGIVTQSMFDYFLCSHSGIQGTSRPCHYFVLHDDNGFTTNQMQLLSHYLCHIYSRCPRSVSYPAPAYYAHLAAFRGRDYIRKIPNFPNNINQITSYEIELHPNIKNKMFFN